MENAVEALKIAGAVLMFILALSLSISCLSSANSSALNIASMYSRERECKTCKWFYKNSWYRINNTSNVSSIWRKYGNLF